MPNLLTPVLTGTASTVTRVVAYGAIGILVIFLLYSAFLKPTTANHTTVQSGGVVNHYWENAQIKSYNLFGGCQDLHAEEFMKSINKKK